MNIISKLISTPLKVAALGLAFALLFSAGAQAQSNSTGNITGKATAGDVVTIENPKTGFKRTLTVGESGRFRAGALPLGAYVVTLKHADGTVYLSKTAAVRLGLTTKIE